MKQDKPLKIKEIFGFLIPYGILLILGALALLLSSKGDLVLFFNENRTNVASIFFTIASKLAEYPFIIFFIVVLLNLNFGKAFMTALTWLVSGLAAQSLKRLFDAPRPAAFFDEGSLHFLANQKIHYAHSFPSGHTTTAFALFFLFALFTSKPQWQFLFFMLALSVALSRVYLLLHFGIDVYFGSILGVLIASLVFVCINSSNIFGFQSWKNKRIGKKNLF